MEIEHLLALCKERSASDLHLSAGLPPTLRIDGDMLPLDAPPLDSAGVRRRLGALAPDVGLEPAGGNGARAFAEADFCVATPDSRFRVNVFEQQRGTSAVLRAIPAEVPTLEQLDLGPVFRDIAAKANGLVLVTGPTGSGKSTTLAALVDHVNKTRRQHILTLEDPIEFLHKPAACLVSQREVGRDTASFATALRAALREDPDVILVGEMRDLETIRLALTAAETGHLVFATLHTSSAPKCVDRIVDSFPAGEKEVIRSMLSESLQAVIAQVLVKRIGGGRAAAHEIMLATPAVRNLIREHKLAQLRSTIQTSGAVGMQTLEQALARLEAQGAIEPQSGH